MTVRVKVSGLERVDADLSAGRTPVFAVPHHTILLSALSYRNRPATLLASLSADGELAASFLKRRGFRLVRGSSSRGGKEALESLKSAIAEGDPVAITFDGPRGPRLIPKAGIAVCAYHAEGSVYLLKCSIRPALFFKNGLALRLKSWDKFILPLPFCSFNAEFSPIETAPKEAPLEEWLPDTLGRIRAAAENFYS